MTSQDDGRSNQAVENKPVPTSDSILQGIADIVDDQSTVVIRSEEHQLRRMIQVLRNRRGHFGLLFAVCNEAHRRERLTREIMERAPEQRPVTLYLTGSEPSLLKALLDAPRGKEPLFVFNLELLLPSSDAFKARRDRTLQELQQQREQFRRVKRPLVLWMPEYVYSIIGLHAVDFWSWQGGAFLFSGQTPSALTDLDQGTQPVVSSSSVSGPLARGVFIGRNEEVDSVIRALDQGQQIVIVRGMAGIGKTSVVSQVAERVKSKYDGAFMVRLQQAGVQEGLADVIRRFHPTEPLPAHLSDLVALYRSTLRGRRVLIILDDVQDEESVRPFIPPPGSNLLITTRRILAIQGATVSLETLPLDDAVRLLTTIAPSLAEGEALRLAEVCHYHPLMLTIAASLVATEAANDGRHLVDILASIHQKPALEDDSVRHEPYLVILEYAYSRLDSYVQEVLAQLSVFAGSFDRAAAKAVVYLANGDHLQFVDLSLDTLTQYGLLFYDNERSRFAMHPLVQQFASQKLTEPDTVYARYATYYTKLGRLASSLYRKGGSDTATGLHLFDQEVVHLRAAYEWLRVHHPADSADFLDDIADIAAAHLPAEEWIAWLDAQMAVAKKTGRSLLEMRALTNLGTAHFERGNTTEARGYFEQALGISRELGQRRWESIALGNLANAYAAVGEVARAIELYEQLLAISREMGDRLGEATSLTNIGNAYSALGDTRRAIEVFEQALVIKRVVGDRMGQGSVLGNLGIAYKNLGETSRAIELYEQQLAIAREFGDRRGEAAALGNLGNAYAALGETRRAIELYEQQLVITREFGDRRGEGAALNNLGNAYAALGETRRAIELYEQQLFLISEVGDRRGEAATLGNLGNVYAALGNYQQALTYLEQALPLFSRVGDKAGEATTLSNIGSVLSTRGDQQSALHFFEQALALFRQIGDVSREVGTLTRMGESYYSLGEPQSALLYFEQALPLAEQLGDVNEQASVTYNMGNVYADLAMPQQALAAYERALLLMQESGATRGYAFTLRNIAEILSAQGREQQALEVYKRALSLLQELGEQRVAAATLNNIGVIYSNLGYIQQALTYFESALSLVQEAGGKRVEATTLSNLASIYAETGDKQKALMYYQRALPLMQQLGDKRVEAAIQTRIKRIQENSTRRNR